MAECRTDEFEGTSHQENVRILVLIPCVYVCTYMCTYFYLLYSDSFSCSLHMWNEAVYTYICTAHCMMC